MPTAEVKSVWWACITWPRKSEKHSLSSLLLGANANKATTLDPSELSMLCLIPISVFFTHSLRVVFRKGQGTVSKRRGLLACVLNNDTYGKLLSPNHLWSLPAAPHSDLSARQYKGVFRDVMFDRLLSSTLSEDTSEVLVQPHSPQHREGNLCGSCSRKTYPETV